MNWMFWVLFVGLLGISSGQLCSLDRNETQKLKGCFKNNKMDAPLIVPDKFYGIINTQKQWNKRCIIFLQKNRTEERLCNKWPQMKTVNNDSLLYITKWHKKNNVVLYFLQGRQCNANVTGLTARQGNGGPNCNFNSTANGNCTVRCLQAEICKSSAYDENNCNNRGPQLKNRYIINMKATKENCVNCDNPVKEPEEEFDASDLNKYNITLEFEEGEEVNAAQAADIMDKMSNLASSINGSSVALTVGEGVTGILVAEKEPEEVKEVHFAYVSPNTSMNILDNKDELTLFSRSITVPKEAFEKSHNLNASVLFAAILRFTNLAKDEMNSTILGNEVLAIEMGTLITNLTDKISISFRNMKFEGNPSCQSWNGEGNRPNWTDNGCVTKASGNNITCQCSHLTFFAILLAPPNETISSSDLSKLTTITQIGCGLSMFFLSIVLFMHFLLRRTKATITTRILIHLVLAMLMLNFTFLINNYVAKLNSSVGCKIMAALMHYFMLATFTWFAVQAFHISMQVYMGGQIVIRHYMLKVCVTSWVLPSVVGIVLLIIGKYGEQVISTDDTEENVAMCWITDNDVHYIVNMGYYALVFLVTFTTFVIILSWLFCLKRTNIGKIQSSRSGKNIVTIMGLCCMLGITWGFAFFAHGALKIPSYYIFTILNSFQGFFLFIYYYNTRHSAEINSGEKGCDSTTNSTSTLKTSVDSLENPYMKGKK